MPDAYKWVKWLDSDKAALKLRATKALLSKKNIPLDVLLKILDVIFGDPFVDPAILEQFNFGGELSSGVIRHIVDHQDDLSLTQDLLPHLKNPNKNIRTVTEYAIKQFAFPSSLPEDSTVLPDAPPTLSVLVLERKHDWGRLPIYNATDYFQPFPDPESVFSEEVELHSQYLLPLATVDLSKLNSELEGKVHFIQPIEPEDSLVGDGTDPYHTFLCRENYVAYKYVGDHCKFATDFRYFKRCYLESIEERDDSEQQILDGLVEHYNIVGEEFSSAREHFHKHGALYRRYSKPPYPDEDRQLLAKHIGGYADWCNWSESPLFPLLYKGTLNEEGERDFHAVPVTQDGNTFIYIGKVSSDYYLRGKSFALGCELLLFYDPISKTTLTTFNWS